MGDVDNNIIVFNPLYTFKTSPVDRIFMSLLEDIIDTLEPRIWQISRLNELNLHRFPQMQANFIKLIFINPPIPRLSTERSLKNPQKLYQ
jgi:hypothetical protein